MKLTSRSVPVALVAFLVTTAPILGGRPAFSAARHPNPRHAPSLIDWTGLMDANSLSMVVSNLGSFGYDYPTSEPGLEYPRGSGKFVLFAGGLWLGSRVGGDTRVTVAEYTVECAPGPMSGGTYLPDDPSFRNYRIDRGDTLSADYLAWPVSQGAPTDAQGKPLLLGDAMIWSVYNDADPAAHTNAVGGTAPLGVEVRQSTFAFNRPGALGKVVFMKWTLRNRGAEQLDGAYVSVWVDPDVGGFFDDLVGCDTTRSLGYAYNATNNDADYGSTPPALGIALLQGPTVEVSPGVNDTLGMTSFVHFTNGTDPVSSDGAYRLMRGLKTDGSPIHVLDDPGLPITTYEVSGMDPGAPSGPANWLDVAPSDRRFMLSSGPFAMSPGDSQEIVVAVLVGQGTDRLASIADLRAVRGAVEAVYRNGFVPQTPTAIEASVLGTQVYLNRVVVSWHVSTEAGVVGQVARRTPTTDWRVVGPRVVPVSRTIRFEDEDVTPGGRYGYRLRLSSGAEEALSEVAWVEVPTADTPAASVLRVGYPNPSARGSEWSYYLPHEGKASLSVWDVHGRLVRVLTEGVQAPGWKRASWDGANAAGVMVASGLYLVRLETMGRAESRKVVITR